MSLIVFALDQHYPRGGLGDRIGVFQNVGECADFLSKRIAEREEEYGDSYSSVQILDTVTLQMTYWTQDEFADGFDSPSWFPI